MHATLDHSEEYLGWKNEDCYYFLEITLIGFAGFKKGLFKKCVRNFGTHLTIRIHM
jgi:hypothetical protein